MSHDRELEVALEACRRARRRILEAYAPFQPIRDARADIKLQIDRESQEILLQHLDAAFPQDSFCAEEDTPTLSQAKAAGRNPHRVWVVDPIDGTRGFAQKNGEYSVMVGLIERDEVVLGVVLEPSRQRLTFATRGGGCWRQDDTEGTPQRCQVSRVARPQEATVTTSHSTGRSRQMAALQPARILAVYSAGIKLALVARGEADLYLNTYPNFHDWDMCAGHILVEEAGGRATTLRGDPVTYGHTAAAAQRHGLLASNGAIHEAALASLRGAE